MCQERAGAVRDATKSAPPTGHSSLDVSLLCETCLATYIAEHYLMPTEGVIGVVGDGQGVRMRALPPSLVAVRPQLLMKRVVSDPIHRAMFVYRGLGPISHFYSLILSPCSNHPLTLRTRACAQRCTSASAHAFQQYQKEMRFTSLRKLRREEVLTAHLRRTTNSAPKGLSKPWTLRGLQRASLMGAGPLGGPPPPKCVEYC